MLTVQIAPRNWFTNLVPRETRMKKYAQIVGTKIEVFIFANAVIARELKKRRGKGGEKNKKKERRKPSKLA